MWDPDNRAARAEAGSLVRDLDEATQRFGLATPSGGCSTVGIAADTPRGRQDMQIWLLTLYGKDEAADLTPKEKRLLKAGIAEETRQRIRRRALRRK